MTFSEFLDLLKNHKIDFEYDGWNHSSVLNYENHEYSFRIYLEEDEDDKNIANQPITKFENPRLVLNEYGNFGLVENKND